MRDYAKVSPKFWMGKTGKDLRKQGMEAQLVGLYLLTSPHSNMLGLYTLPVVYIAHETSLGLEGAWKGLQGCIEAGFCQYDEESETVWVIEMAHFQIADKLKAKDNQCAGIQKAYDELIENPFLSTFYDKYAEDFHLTGRRTVKAPSKAPSKPLSKPLRSQEQEQEQEQEQKQEQEQNVVERRNASPDRDVVGDIFAYWQKTMESPRSQLDDKRSKAIKAALKTYDPRQVCEAIKGCSRSDFHMARGKYAGNNKQNGLGLILRDADHIEKFMELANNRAATGTESIEERNKRILAELMAEDASVDPDVIDVEMEEVANAS